MMCNIVIVLWANRKIVGAGDRRRRSRSRFLGTIKYITCSADSCSEVRKECRKTTTGMCAADRGVVANATSPDFDVSVS